MTLTEEQILAGIGEVARSIVAELSSEDALSLAKMELALARARARGDENSAMQIAGDIEAWLAMDRAQRDLAINGTLRVALEAVESFLVRVLRA